MKIRATIEDSARREAHGLVRKWSVTHECRYHRSIGFTGIVYDIRPASSTPSTAPLTRISYPLSAAAKTSLQAATPLMAAATPT
jgi:hypothetical protein